MKFPKSIPDDDVLAKAFITSAFLGVAGLVAPVVLPVALTGMAVSQGLFWSREITKNDQKSNDNSN